MARMMDSITAIQHTMLLYKYGQIACSLTEPKSSVRSIALDQVEVEQKHV